MFEKDGFDPKAKLDPRSSALKTHGSVPTRSSLLQQPSSTMSVHRPWGDSLTRQLLLKERRDQLIRSYKEIMWQQRTMDDSNMFDFDPFHYMDEE